MDHRVALESGTQLQLFNNNELFVCTIDSEIGRGASCIVYQVYRYTNTKDITYYRVKEFYPYNMKIIRDSNLNLIPDNQELFSNRKKEFCLDFSRSNDLYYSNGNYASMVNQLDVYESNGTIYILSSYSSNETLDTYCPESLKECIYLTKQVAYVLGKIHQQGYLYLDCKPENILVIDGIQKQIQLFDFDSLISIKNFHSNYKLSYTEGFSSIEVKTCNIKRIGFQSDVYGIGSLLFYLLFEKTPCAPDCEIDACYDFSKIKYNIKHCDDTLFRHLQNFFHKTLAVYYKDRFSNMEETIQALETLERLADEKEPRIYSTSIYSIPYFFGREKEFNDINELLKKEKCIFITGMGGIGKSALIKEYLVRYKNQFDMILYVSYKEDIVSTICDDFNIRINTLHQEENQKDRYFDQKIEMIQYLVEDTNSILVIDHFDGNFNEDVYKLLNLNLKIIFISRYLNCEEGVVYTVHELEKQCLQPLFEFHLHRSLKENEIYDFFNICQCIQNHTLVLELIAKQIYNSHITLKEASCLALKNGFTYIAKEKIDSQRGSIQDIIGALFSNRQLSKQKKSILKVASLLKNGMDIHLFQKTLKLETFDEINECIQEGWLMCEKDVVSLHRVIAQSIHHWKWDEESLYVAKIFLSYFYFQIHNELHVLNQNRWMHLKKYITYSIDILCQCKKEPVIQNCSIYLELLYVTLLNGVRFDEEFFLNHYSLFLKKEKNPVSLMKVYKAAILVHLDHHQINVVENLLKQAKELMKKSHRFIVSAHYYDLLSYYFDDLLNGNYDSEEVNEMDLRNRLLDSIDKTLYYSKYKMNHLYIKNLLAKTTILIRSGISSQNKIEKNIKQVYQWMQKNTDADVCFEFYLVCAWYFVYTQNDVEHTIECIKQAEIIKEQIYMTDLEKIEELYIPSANLLYECGYDQEAISYLEQGIQICLEHKNVKSYVRLEKELRNYISEI
ncbi:protein kinase domain-containing protein [Floccifex sp.]|uniref:protein kinase domain-containing protein n=1 Tax=Floccifex sp. TaxID=2815810 RepID=UPI003F107587